MIRYDQGRNNKKDGELTNDEYFVTEAAAKAGVMITNTSKTEPIVVLKHFAENPELQLEK